MTYSIILYTYFSQIAILSANLKAARETHERNKSEILETRKKISDALTESDKLKSSVSTEFSEVSLH